MLYFFLSISGLFAQQTEVYKEPPSQQSCSKLVGEFSKLSIKGPVDVVLRASDHSEIVFDCSEEIRSKITVKIHKHLASVYFNEAVLINSRQKRAKIIVYVKKLSKISMKGPGSIVTDSMLKLRNLEIEQYGSGALSMNLKVQSLVMHIKGSSQVKLRGKAHSLKVSCMGSSLFSGTQFITENADVLVKGSSKIDLHANNSLKVHISGSAKVRYSGDPKVSIRKARGSNSILPI
ncbi:MAG: hypothetical protein S4CHLAM7_14880 [Chlamydiae bacterium]|nr:hypothetical protein [Chlamydiota bacterium]